MRVTESCFGRAERAEWARGAQGDITAIIQRPLVASMWAVENAFGFAGFQNGL